MKHLDTLSKRILAISFSLMGLMLCASLFIATINSATANNQNLPLPSYQNGELGDGQILMDYTSVHVPSQDKTYYEVMVWNTKTGKSKLYFYDYTDKKFEAYGDNVQLPAHPLD